MTANNDTGSPAPWKLLGLHAKAAEEIGEAARDKLGAQRHEDGTYSLHTMRGLSLKQTKAIIEILNP